MALLHVNFNTDSLGYPSQMYVILPQKEGNTRTFNEINTNIGAAPVLYLLHGGSDDYTSGSEELQ